MYCHIDIPYVPFFLLCIMFPAPNAIYERPFSFALYVRTSSPHISLFLVLFSQTVVSISRPFLVPSLWLPREPLPSRDENARGLFLFPQDLENLGCQTLTFFSLSLVSRLRIRYSFTSLYSFAAERRPVPDRRHLLPVLRLPHRALHLLHRQVLRGGVHIPGVKGRRRHQTPKKRKDLSKSRYF